jgi:hypothetical protein
MDWITTHEEDMAAQLPDYLRKPRFEAFVRVLARRTQKLEDALRALQEGWWLANAAGTQLDGLGELLVEPRGLLGDAEYRLRLQARIRALRGSGTPDELIGLLKLLNPTLRVQLREEYPAALVLQVSGGPLPYPDVHLYLLGRARAGGVRLLLGHQDTADEDALTLVHSSGADDGLTVARAGLSSLATPTEGGTLVSIREATG